MLKESEGEFRAVIRETYPQLLGEFSPITSVDDAMELREMAYELKYCNGSEEISSYHLDKIFGSSSRKEVVDEEKLADFFGLVRDKLKGLNTKLYAQKFEGFDDYQLVKQYTSICRELKAN